MRVLALGVLALLVGVPLPVEAQQSLPFFDRALVRGVDLQIYGSTLQFGRGFAINDLDGDGDLDLVFTGRIDGAVVVYENTGGGFFADRTTVSAITPSTTYSSIIAGDYDADGDLDLYIGAVLNGGSAENKLFRNDGAFTFTDVTAVAGVGETGEAMGCSWGDFDGDGYLDLYVCNHPTLLDHENVLYRNNGDGTFSDVTSVHGVEDSGFGFQGTFFDFDVDGDVDLYLSNDHGVSQGMPNRLWRNDGGSLVDVSAASGAGVAIDSMGVAYGDLDGNGFVDLYCSSTSGAGGNPLLLNNGDGTFDAIFSGWGIEVDEVSWGTCAFDAHNDGRLDLFVGTAAAPDRFFVGSATPPWLDQAGSYGLDFFGLTFCVEAGDLDGDGDMDLVIQRPNESIKLMMNESAATGNWLGVRLASASNNHFGIGATVRVTIGGETWTRQMVGTGNFKTSRPYQLHFGVGAATVVDLIEVHWPGGGISTFIDVPTGQTITLDDSTAVLPLPRFVRGDANTDGAFDIADGISVLGHLFASAPVLCTAALDVNDDDLIDISDAISALFAVLGSGPLPSAPFPDCDESPSLFECSSNPACP